MPPCPDVYCFPTQSLKLLTIPAGSAGVKMDSTKKESTLYRDQLRDQYHTACVFQKEITGFYKYQSHVGTFISSKVIMS